MITRPKPLPFQTQTQSSQNHDFSSVSMQELKGSQVFVSFKKNDISTLSQKEPHHLSTNEQTQKQNQPKNKDRKTIESTIKQLLKGKQELFSYLESEKQFIQILNVHDHNQLRHLPKNRSKLTSSLTEKKKSRIDTYSTAKNASSFHFSQFPSRKNKIKKTQNQALTMEVVKKQTQSNETQQTQSIEKRQYETVSFDNVYLEQNKKYHPESQKQKYVRQKPLKITKQKKSLIISSKENNHSGFESIVIASPQKKKLKLNEKSNFDHNHFYATKYGLTHFSPWAFGKNQYDSQLGENESILEDDRRTSVFRQRVANSEAKPRGKENKNQGKKDQSDRIQNPQPKRNQYLKPKNTNIQKQTIDSQNENLSLKNRKKLQDSNDFKSKQDKKDNQNYLKSTIEVSSNEKQNLLNKQHNVRLKSQKIIKDDFKPSVPNGKVVKSSQVIILQSGTINSSSIFASKEYAKQMFHPRKSLKIQPTQGKQTSFKEEDSIFQTEINTSERQKQRCYSQQNLEKLNSSEIVGEQMGNNELEELKKTEEFLKEIILTKNLVSYSNSRQISQKQFKNIQQTIYEENQVKRSNLFMTKNILENKPHSQKSPRNKQFYSASSKGYETGGKQSRNSDEAKSSAEKENSEIYRIERKTKTSLGNPLCDKNVYDAFDNYNSKCLTQASLNGFYLINESKIRNTKNSFVRRKRHSMLVKKKSSNGNNSHSENPQKRFSYSIQKQTFNDNINNLSKLQDSKGFGIINPLTKQLYKKYVSIVQSKRC